MRTVTMMLAGGMFAAMSIGAAHGQFAEELHKTKYGRYSPAKEARLRAAQARTSTVSSKEAVQELAPACCRLHLQRPAAKPSVNSIFLSRYFRMKYGRDLPEEARARAAKEELAAHSHKCLELGQCKTMLAEANANAPCEHACCQ